MSNKEFLIKYEKLLDRGYCNCNEMNCIDNNSPRKILNIAKTLQKENEELQERIDKAIEYIEWQKNNPQYDNVWRKYECESLVDILRGE